MSDFHIEIDVAILTMYLHAKNISLPRLITGGDKIPLSLSIEKS